MSHGEHGAGGFVGEGELGERMRDNRVQALHAARPNTVGYVGGYDQEERKIESPACALLALSLRLWGSGFTGVPRP